MLQCLHAVRARSQRKRTDIHTLTRLWCWWCYASAYIRPPHNIIIYGGCQRRRGFSRDLIAKPDGHHRRVVDDSRQSARVAVFPSSAFSQVVVRVYLSRALVSRQTILRIERVLACVRVKCLIEPSPVVRVFCAPARVFVEGDDGCCAHECVANHNNNHKSVGALVCVFVCILLWGWSAA